MATTTSNFGWDIPQSTDLVKDGATAIAALGNDIDTSLVDLKGGTTGQILSKASGTDLDYSWVDDKGGMTLLSTTTLSGSSVTLTSISQSYINLVLIVRGFRPSAANALRLQLNADSTANRHIYISTNNTINGGTSTAFNDTNAAVIFDTNTGNDYSLANIEIFDYTNTTTWKLGRSWNVTSSDTNSAQFKSVNQTFMYNQTPAITSLKFYVSSGTFTSGTIYLYGVK